MPFYEYECPKCGYQDEVLQKITDKPLKKCPGCGRQSLKKLISAPVFRLKGSGWYETDFKSDKENKRNLAGADKDEAASAGKDAAKPDAKADSKADGKAEGKAAATGADAPKPGAGKSDTPKPAPEKSASRPARHGGARGKVKTRAARRTRR